MFSCRICGNDTNNTHHIGVEKKQGSGDKFNYVRCDDCGCLQIEEYPANIARYYDCYYSLHQPKVKKSLLSDWMRKQLFYYLLGGVNPVGKLLDCFFKNSFNWIVPNKFSFNSSIIDVGCGYGRLILKMAQSGFKNLEGIDPFLESDITYCLNDKRNLFIKKTDLFSLDKQYDVIMLHHVLEHLPNQHDVFQKITFLMHNESVLIINLPTMNNYYWENFGMNAFQLDDVPRHYYIHTHKSLSKIAEKHGLQLLSEKTLENSGLSCFYFSLK